MEDSRLGHQKCPTCKGSGRVTMVQNIIPEMVHELGKCWNQPNPKEFTFREDGAVEMTQKQFKDLGEYSTSLPAGVYEGKMWKKLSTDGIWLLHWYSYHSTPGMCSINYRPIIVV